MSVPGTEMQHAGRAGRADCVRQLPSLRQSLGSAADRGRSQARFGAEGLLRHRDLRPGTDWHRDIEERVRASRWSSGVGPRWVTIADERGRRRVLQPEEEDVVRTEIEAALRGAGRVVPVLVDDAALPSREGLPRPFRPITSLNAVTLRNASWNQDLESLVGALAARRRSRPRSRRPPGPRPEAWEPAPGGPGQNHYRRIAKAVSRGALVPVLGAGAHAAADGGNWEPGCGRLPDAAELSSRWPVSSRWSPSRPT